MIFDNNGNLYPHQILQTDLQEFEAIFVTPFVNSGTRNNLFEVYLKHTFNLRTVIGNNFYQWIDGSFVTQKQNPNDIDVVTFIDWQVHEYIEKELTVWRRSINKKMLDCYFVKVYPSTHSSYFLYENDALQWQFQFGYNTRTRKNKGFVQLNFD